MTIALAITGCAVLLAGALALVALRLATRLDADPGAWHD